MSVPTTAGAGEGCWWAGLLWGGWSGRVHRCSLFIEACLDIVGNSLHRRARGTEPAAAGGPAWAGKQHRGGWVPTRKAVEGKGSLSTGDRLGLPGWCQWSPKGEGCLQLLAPFWGPRTCRKDSSCRTRESRFQGNYKLVRMTRQVFPSLRARMSPVWAPQSQEVLLGVEGRRK